MIEGLFKNALRPDVIDVAHPMIRQSGWTIANYSSPESVGNLTLAIKDILTSFTLASPAAASILAEKVAKLEKSLNDISETDKR
jgi:hypothetical protein